MAATTRVPLAPRVRRGHDALAFTGTIPPELDGCLIRVGRHPVAGESFLESGIRLSGGLAKWYRRAPHGPATAWRAAHVRFGERHPDELGAAAVARPVADPATNLWRTVATYPGLGYAEQLWLDADGMVRRAEPFALDGAPLVHAVSATARYLVMFDLPVTHRRAVALLGDRFPYAWQEGRPARIGLLGRDGEPPRWFPIRPCYVFNAVNAYDDGDRVVVDALRFDERSLRSEQSILRHLGACEEMPAWRAFDPTAGRRPPELWRWTLDLRHGTVDERPLTAFPQEFPEVDPRVRGRRHRYVFGAGQSSSRLVRHDLTSGLTRVHALGEGRTPEAPVFVPRPGASSTAEGDGWLITVVHDLAGGRSELLILDAQELDGPPVATVALPVRLRPSLHTHWQPGG